MSRYSKVIAGGALLSLAFGGAVHAQAFANQVVAFEVQSINQIAIIGTPSLVINTAVAGSQPTTSASDATGSYSITTNEASRKITIELTAAMPHDVTLTATLTAPSVGLSAGPLALTTSPQDAVTGIAQVIGSGLTITYTLDATVAAGVVAATSRTVVLTIVAGA